MGATGVPWWVALMVGVLTLVGAIGGAWGGQIIAGRNERRRTEADRDRDREAHWRDRRLDLYASLLSGANAEVHRIGTQTRLMNPLYEPPDPDVELDRMGAELHTLNLIGSTAARNLTWQFVEDAGRLWSRTRHPSRAKTAVDGGRMEDLSEDLDALASLLVKINDRYRKDLGVSADLTRLPA